MSADSRPNILPNICGRAQGSDRSCRATRQSGAPAYPIIAKMAFRPGCLNDALGRKAVCRRQRLRFRRPDTHSAGSRAEGLTGMIVNLNRYRKKRQRDEAEASAAANRARFGRSKEEREKEERERERAEKALDEKRLE